MADGRQVAFDRIHAAILAGDYAPHQRLIEAELCDRFGVSRFVLRAVFQDLAAQGLIEFQPNRGARVRAITLDEAIEITEVRRVLEGFEAARAATLVTDAEAASLRTIAADMRAAVQASELLRYGQLNVALHAAIRDIARHETSARLLRELRDQTSRHQFSLSLVPGRPAVSLPQHEEIVEAIVRRDPERAEAAMHAHLSSVVEAYRALAPSVEGE